MVGGTHTLNIAIGRRGNVRGLDRLICQRIGFVKPNSKQLCFTASVPRNDASVVTRKTVKSRLTAQSVVAGGVRPDAGLALAQGLSGELSSAHREAAEGISRIARGIAHSLNNVLAISRGNLMLLRGGEQSGDSLEMIDDALTSLMDAERLSTNLAELANVEPFVLSEVDAANVVALVVEGVRESLGPDAQVIVESEEGLPKVLADARFLELAVKAVARNGIESMGSSGRLEISCQWMPERVGTARSICIRVTDNGPGFAHREIVHAFEPGFSTKKNHSHIGIGLWFARQVALACGGNAVITSTPGKPGGVVEIRLVPADTL
jgi:signal transduction histidine kinase